MKIEEIGTLVQKIQSEYPFATVEIKFEVGRKVGDFAALVTLEPSDSFLESPIKTRVESCWIGCEWSDVDYIFGALNSILQDELSEIGYLKWNDEKEIYEKV